MELHPELCLEGTGASVLCLQWDLTKDKIITVLLVCYIGANCIAYLSSSLLGEGFWRLVWLGPKQHCEILIRLPQKGAAVTFCS